MIDGLATEGLVVVVLMDGAPIFSADEAGTRITPATALAHRVALAALSEAAAVLARREPPALPATEAVAELEALVAAVGDPVGARAIKDVVANARTAIDTIRSIYADAVANAAGEPKH